MPIVTEAAEPEPSGREKLSFLRDFHGPFLHREKLPTRFCAFFSLLLRQLTSFWRKLCVYKLQRGSLMKGDTYGAWDELLGLAAKAVWLRGA